MSTQVVSNSKPSVVVALAKSLSDVGDTKKLLKFAIVTIDFVGKMPLELPPQFKELHHNFKECSSTLSFLGTVGVVKMWMEDKKTRWQGTVALINLTALQAISSAFFLEKLKLINLSYITMTIGTTPVLSFAMTYFGLGGSIFSLWDNIREYQETNASKVSCREEWGTWSDRKGQFVKIQDNEVDNKIREYFGSKVLDLLSSKHLSEQDRKVYLEKRLDYEVTKWNTVVAGTSAKLDKLLSGLVMNIVMLAISILGLAGQYYGIAALAATGVPMLTVALVMAGFGVYQMLQSNMKVSQAIINPLESAKNQLMIAARSEDSTLVPAF